MASNFAQYTNGVQMPTGIAEAGANIGRFAQQGLSNFGAGLAQGIEAYNDNSAKSEAANAKIQMLGQEYADKIAMYAKDPEIAQSGILDGLMAKAKMLQDAPTKGLSQRVMIAHDAETSLSGFGNKLQEWSFLRGRQMEQETQAALQKFSGVKSVTDPQFVAAGEFQVDPNKSLTEQKQEVLTKLNKIRSLNPTMQGSDDEFMSAWLSNAEQTMAKADPNVVPPAVASSYLEQIQADKQLQKSKAESEKTGLAEGFLARGKKSSMADYQKVMTPATNVLLQKKTATPAVAPAGLEGKYVSPSEVSSAQKELKTRQNDLRAMFGTTIPTSGKEKKTYDDMQSNIKSLQDKITFAASDKNFEYGLAVKKAQELNAQQAPLKAKSELESYGSKVLTDVSSELKSAVTSGKDLTIYDLIKSITARENKDNPTIRDEFVGGYGGAVLDMGMPAQIKVVQQYSPASDVIKQKAKELKIDLEKPLNADQLKAVSDAITAGITTTKQKSEEIAKQAGKVATPESVTLVQQQQAETPKVAPIPMGEMVVGTKERTIPLSITERQQQVANYITQKMGAIDPSDPTGQRRLPPSGFDKFYRSLVPEAEIREYTTPSGVRMMYSNGKWEQIKTAEPMTIQDLRKSLVGVFGTQDQNGQLRPAEYIPDTGVYLSGLYKGNDTSLEKFEDEMTRLIDARRSVKKLSEINDRVGEFFSPSAQGEAEVEVMNLSAMLRTDIVGVGTVSNYEQNLIRDVIRNPTNFFNLESKDRAILLALAQRVDRRMKNIATSKGLTIQIKDQTDGNKYQVLREQYLKEKGILK